PAREQRQEQAGSQKRSAQIVEHFPAADYGNLEFAFAGRSRAAADDPCEKLPIAACPPVLARRGSFVVGRKLLEKLNVGGECATRENSLEEVVAEQNIFGNFAGNGGFE